MVSMSSKDKFWNRIEILTVFARIFIFHFHALIFHSISWRWCFVLGLSKRLLLWAILQAEHTFSTHPTYDLQSTNCQVTNCWVSNRDNHSFYESSAYEPKQCVMFNAFLWFCCQVKNSKLIAAHLWKKLKLETGTLSHPACVSNGTRFIAATSSPLDKHFDFEYVHKKAFNAYTYLEIGSQFQINFSNKTPING